MKIALCQINPTVGDCAANRQLIQEAVAGNSADLFVFPELALPGYPPRDLLDHAWFLATLAEEVEHLKAFSATQEKKAFVIGTVEPVEREDGQKLANVALMIQGGEIVLRQEKKLLPTYDVFDEQRYFVPGTTTDTLSFMGEELGLVICEDGWNVPEFAHSRQYRVDPVAELVEQGATFIVNISASPFYHNKQEDRYICVASHVARHKVPMVLVNSVGGNDELIFDGGSIYMDKDGNYQEELPFFKEQITIIDTEAPSKPLPAPKEQDIASVHDALVLGLRDYFAKTGFKKALLGLSGGIDSAVTAALAVTALGAENVLGITLPSQHSSEGSVGDSYDLARNLGITCEEIAIEGMYTETESALSGLFEGTTPGVAEENLQARLRGVLLMAVSNKFGSLLLTTGNKSEMAVGYCTLYGDMNGGLAVLADVYKMDVYALARYQNRDREVIPVSTIDKAPSAELRPDQKDEDSLPPYPVLDAMLKALLEDDATGADLIAQGHDGEMVQWIIRQIKINEYKRRQSAIILKVTPKAFGTGRRFPVAARYQW